MSLVKLPTDIGLDAAVRQAGKKYSLPKGVFSLARVYDVLDRLELELHDMHLSEDSLTLVVDGICPETRNAIATKLQKRAVPKSKYKFRGGRTFLAGKIRTEIVFVRRGEG